MRYLSPVDLKDEIQRSAPRPTSFTYDTIKFTFRLKYVDGMTITLNKLMRPSLSEEEQSTYTEDEVRSKCKEWADKNDVLYWYDWDNCLFLFAPKKQKSW